MRISSVHVYGLISLIFTKRIVFILHRRGPTNDPLLCTHEVEFYVINHYDIIIQHLIIFFFLKSSNPKTPWLCMWLYNIKCTVNMRRFFNYRLIIILSLCWYDIHFLFSRKIYKRVEGLRKRWTIRDCKELGR